MLRNNPMSAFISVRAQISRRFPSRNRVKLPIRPSSFLHISLPDARPRYERFLCGGRLTYRNAGRDYRLTDVYGDVLREIVA